MTNNVRFAAYGTLRKGSYNYERFKEHFGNEFEYKETQTSQQKFVMLDNGVYPYLMTEKQGCQLTPIVFDIIECSPECYHYILAMEEGAGYHEGEVDLNGISYKIFLFAHDTNHPQIETGDWQNKTAVENEEIFARN